MTAVTRAIGVILIVVGVGAWLLAGGPGTSLTALLPAVLGVVILVLGLLAGRGEWHRHVIHAALVVALLGFLGTIPQVVPLFTGDAGLAEWASLVTALVCLVYLVLGTRSFVAARRARP